ncbi:MAG TPA: capsule assembly Wzi family protein, partial [Firmicutes bacterium]|nr:capsule assembly Wzi family protein [Bacillota bacterium]
FTVGRSPVKWGPGRFGALLLSDNAPLDGVVISFPLGDVDYTQLIAARDVTESQYLLGHRIEWAPRKGMTLGISETLAFSRGFKLSPAYIMPALPYHFVQYFAIHGDSRQDRYTNVLAGVDARLELSRALELYGEFLADDFPWSPSTWGRVPPMVGLLLGFELRDVPWLGYSTLSAEYARINNYVYSHKNPDNAYLHRGELLGHWLGPDADALCIEVSRRVSNSLDLAAKARFERHGEGRVGQSWRREYGVRDQFLSGIIETRKVLGVAATWPYMKVSAEIASLSNADHIPGESRLTGEVGVSVWWHFGSAANRE